MWDIHHISAKSFCLFIIRLQHWDTRNVLMFFIHPTWWELLCLETRRILSWSLRKNCSPDIVQFYMELDCCVDIQMSQKILRRVDLPSSWILQDIHKTKTTSAWESFCCLHVKSRHVSITINLQELLWDRKINWAALNRYSCLS